MKLSSPKPEVADLKPETASFLLAS